MWHSTHHVLSLAVLNHCPFNTELTTRNHPRIRDPTNRFERLSAVALSIITRWHDDCFVLFVVVSRPHQTQHVACRLSDCLGTRTSLLLWGLEYSSRGHPEQIWETVSIITRWHDDCFVLFVVASRPHQTQHVACRLSRLSDCRLSGPRCSDRFEMTDRCIKSNSDALLSVGLIVIFARYFTIWKASNESNASLSLSPHCFSYCKISCKYYNQTNRKQRIAIAITLLCSLCSRFKTPPNTTCGIQHTTCCLWLF